MFKINVYVTLFLFTLFIGACDSEEPDPVGAGEEELITTVTLTLTPDTGDDIVTATFNDPDGDGLNPSIGALNVDANTTYQGVISLRDDANGEDITAEVEAEADDHQLWYTPGGTAADRIMVTITDQDSNNLPLGLTFTLVVSDGPEATASLNVVLSHYDVAPKDGVTRSDESDIDIIFPVNIDGN